MAKLFIKDGIVKPANLIVIKTGNYQIINPTEDMLLAEGWAIYTPPAPKEVVTENDIVNDYIKSELNGRIDINDETALKYAQLVYAWNSYIDKSLKAGQVVSHEDKIYRVMQDIDSVLAIYPPGPGTEALYTVVDYESAGTLEDPIPYDGNMELFSGKYYIQDGIIYLCNRDTGAPVYHALRDLVGLYVEVVK